MLQHFFEAMAVFAAAFAAFVAVGVGLLFWGRRRLRRLRAELLLRVGRGELTPSSLLATLRLNRHTLSTAAMRRRLSTNVAGASAAVRAAERTGVPVGDLGRLSAELEQAASSIDELLDSMGPAGATPVVLVRANELSRSAKQLRRAAELAATRVAVPAHRELTVAIDDAVRPLPSR